VNVEKHKLKSTSNKIKSKPGCMRMDNRIVTSGMSQIVEGNARVRRQQVWKSEGFLDNFVGVTIRVVNDVDILWRKKVKVSDLSREIELEIGAGKRRKREKKEKRAQREETVTVPHFLFHTFVPLQDHSNKMFWFAYYRSFQRHVAPACTIFQLPLFKDGEAHTSIYRCGYFFFLR